MIENTELSCLIVDALEDLKALEIRIIDVRGQTSVTDWLVIASGTSSRHVKSLADHVIQEMKKKYGVTAFLDAGISSRISSNCRRNRDRYSVHAVCTQSGIFCPMAISLTSAIRPRHCLRTLEYDAPIIALDRKPLE